MDITVLRYIVIIVAALILIWAAFEVRSRVVRRRKHDVRTFNAWVSLDSRTVAHNKEEESRPLSIEENGEQEEPVDKIDVHSRAQQNGHYTPSKKTL
ncbi:MAG TPA: hypothetical protein VF026_15450 [Ktedonobacteraceae bacterium]